VGWEDALARAAGYWALLSRNRNFRLLFGGVTISFFGDWFTTIALYTMVQTLSDSATAVALVLVAKTLPVFLASPIAGPIVDRYDRRLVLLTTIVLRAFLTVALLGGWMLSSVPIILLSEVVRASVNGVFIPCREAALPAVVDEGELAPAMALNGGAWSVMLAMGAAAGGAVTAWLGVTGALAIDVLTFVVAGAIVAGLPSLPPREDDDGVDETVRFVDGLRYLKERVPLAVLLTMKSGQALSGAAIVAIPFYGNGLFSLAGAGFVGLLYAARGLGAMGGSLGLRRLVGDDSLVLRRMLGPLFLVQVVAYGSVAFAPSMAWSALGFFVAGIGGAGLWVFSGIVAQRAIDGPVRGRLFALEFGGMTLVSSLSSLGAGLLMDGLGWSIREVVSGVAVVLLVPAIAAFWLATQRVVPEPA